MIAVWATFESTNTYTLTASTGWASAFTPVDTGNVRMWGWWSLGNNTNLGFTLGGVTGSVADIGYECSDFTGCDLTTPIDATGTASTNSALASITANAVTVATNQAWH